MEKKEIKRLNGARNVIIFCGIVSSTFMVLSEYGDNNFRWSLIFLIIGVMVFMLVVITSITHFLSIK